MGNIVSMIFIAIFIVLFLSRADETTSIINSLAGNAIAGIKTLQARGV